MFSIVFFLNYVIRETNILSNYLQSPNINYDCVNSVSLQRQKRETCKTDFDKVTIKFTMVNLMFEIKYEFNRNNKIP
jgi:glutaredoxin-related protein